MGLDTVELVLEIEREFDVVFSDAAAEHCRTVHEVALYVFGQLHARPASQSGTAPAGVRFQELRASIAELTGADPNSIQPSSTTIDVMPRSIRRAMWRRAKVPLPELHRPPWARTCIAVVGLLVFSGAMFMLSSTGTDTWSSIALSMSLAVVPTLITTLLLLPFKRELPSSTRTIEDLVRASFGWRARSSDPLPGERTFPQVLHRVRELVARQTGLPIEKVLPDSRFIEDLNMG